MDGRLRGHEINRFRQSDTTTLGYRNVTGCSDVLPTLTPLLPPSGTETPVSGVCPERRVPPSLPDRGDLYSCRRTPSVYGKPHTPPTAVQRWTLTPSLVYPSVRPARAGSPDPYTESPTLGRLFEGPLCRWSSLFTDLGEGCKGGCGDLGPGYLGWYYMYGFVTSSDPRHLGTWVGRDTPSVTTGGSGRGRVGTTVGMV